VKRSLKGIAGTMSNPARPGEREKPACSDAGYCSLPLPLPLWLIAAVFSSRSI
jgi:hypothetical protein